MAPEAESALDRIVLMVEQVRYAPYADGREVTWSRIPEARYPAGNGGTRLDPMSVLTTAPDARAAHC